MKGGVVMLKRLLAVVVAGVVGISQIFAMEIKSDTDAIVAMGESEAEMRHMLEFYAFIGAGVKYKKPKDKLKEHIKEHEEVMQAIGNRYKGNKAIMKSVNAEKKAWEPVKNLLLTALSGKKTQEQMTKEALFVDANIRSVIKELENFKKNLVEKSGVKNAKYLDAAEEIGASARRLSAHYMMKMWDLPDPTIMEHWNRGVEIYKHSLEVLEKSKFAKNPEFKKELDTAKQSYDFFMMVIKFKNKYVPIMVQRKADAAIKAGKKMVEIILKDK